MGVTEPAAVELPAAFAQPRAGRRAPAVPDGVLAMLLFAAAEVMLFAGMISAFVIVKSSAPFGWPPPDQPRLPFESTAVNTLALLASGAVLHLSARRFSVSPRAALGPLVAAIALGAGFVVAQGLEWQALLRQGLTLRSSSLGSFFYLIVGCHAAHAIVALGALGWAAVSLARARLTASQFWTVRVLWYFVVAIWPVLYLEVYL